MLTQRNSNQTASLNIETKDMAANFVANVFAWMGIALAITAFTAYYFASNENLIGSLFNPETGMTILGWVVMLAPFGFVLAMGMGFQKFSAGTLTLLFGVFSILMGASLSYIFLIYELGSIFLTFAVTAGMFGVMSFVGYTTKTDLTKFG